MSELEAARSETAGEHLVPVVTARADEPVMQVLARLAAARHDTVHVVDADGRLDGVVPLLALVNAARDAKVGTLKKSVPTVLRDDDHELVTRVAVRHRLSEVPVTSPDGVLVGAVPSVALLAILRAEHNEDIDRLAGIRRERAAAVEAVASSPLHRLRQRLPWLFVGLAGSIGGAIAAERFEGLLDRHVALAFFLPTVIYLADAVSTQTDAVVVRALAVSSTSIRRIVLGELATGTLLGILLGALALPVVIAIAGMFIAITVAVSLVAAAAFATTISLLLTWGLHRAGLDPAYGSGPLGTVIQDVLSLLIYLGVATAIMGS